MTNEEIDSIWAFHSSGCRCGCGNSSSADLDRLRAYMYPDASLSEPQAELTSRIRISEYVRTFLTPEALESGYGWEDAYSFLRWADEGFEARY